jgi:hypothetical protein
MNRIMTYLTGVLPVMALAVLTGCVAIVFAAGAAAGVSGAVWYRGELRTSLAGSLPKVRDASAATLQKMGNGVPAVGGGDLESTLTSYTGDDRKITIELKSLSASVTEIHVRVGFWGDRDLSQHILEDIGNRLGEPSGMARPKPALNAAS